MKLGAISEFNFHLDSSGIHNWKIYNFSISAEALSFNEIPDSAFATPARYVEEIFHRLCLLEKNEQSEAKFIFNPLFETNRLSILLILNELNKYNSFNGTIVFADMEGLPVGYFFPATLQIDDSRFLTLLSTVNSSIDAELVRLLFFAETQCIHINHLHLKQFDNCGFLYKEFSDIYLWVAEKAINLLRGSNSAAITEASPLISNKQFRNSIPFTAIMPFHAGDVLFFAVAYNSTHTHISRIAVNKTYEAIITDNAPRLSRLILESPPPNRDKSLQQTKGTSDEVYFKLIKNQFPEDSFYYYCRPSRNYNHPEFHLIDQFAFGLGQHFFSKETLLINSLIRPKLFKPLIKEYKPCVLLHFDGGWPIKIYPPALQQKLIDLLHAKNYKITVLTDVPYENFKCQTVLFSSYKNLIELIKTHHLLVGMDSFPCHYGAHILGLPTICLFASTKPANSNAPHSESYASLETGLKCRPCYAVRECPLYRTNTCRNFVSPESVAYEVDKMLQAINLEQPHPLPNRINGHVETTSRIEPNSARIKKIKNIRTNYLHIKALFAGLLTPFYCYSSTLQHEFIVAVKREGVIGALRRTSKYLRRSLTRSI